MSVKKSLLFDDLADQIVRFIVYQAEQEGRKVTQGEVSSQYIIEQFQSKRESYRECSLVVDVAQRLVNEGLGYEFETVMERASYNRKMDIATSSVEQYMAMGEQVYREYGKGHDVFLGYLNRIGEVSEEERVYVRLLEKEVFDRVWRFAICLLKQDYQGYEEMKVELVDYIIESNGLIQRIEMNLEDYNLEELKDDKQVQALYQEALDGFDQNLEEIGDYFEEGIPEKCLVFVRANIKEVFDRAWQQALQNFYDQEEYEKGKTVEDMAREAFQILIAQQFSK